MLITLVKEFKIKILLFKDEKVILFIIIFTLFIIFTLNIFLKFLINILRILINQILL